MGCRLRHRFSGSNGMLFIDLENSRLIGDAKLAYLDGDTGGGAQLCCRHGCGAWTMLQAGKKLSQLDRAKVSPPSGGTDA